MASTDQAQLLCPTGANTRFLPPAIMVYTNISRLFWKLLNNQRLWKPLVLADLLCDFWSLGRFIFVILSVGRFLGWFYLLTDFLCDFISEQISFVILSLGRFLVWYYLWTDFLCDFGAKSEPWIEAASPGSYLNNSALSATAIILPLPLSTDAKPTQQYFVWIYTLNTSASNYPVFLLVGIS